MPTLIPTAAEIDAMPPRLREKARRAVARVVAEHMHALDGIAAPDAGRALAVEEWARDVRAQARLMLAALEPDPDAGAHRAALVEAVR